MALCILSGLDANRITSVVFVDERTIASVGNLTKETENSAGSKAQLSCCSLSNQPPHHSRLRKGPAVLVGHRSVDVALKEGEHGEPDACSSTLLVGSGVSQSVVVQEESSGDVECYENINGVMLMCSQDEENSKEIQDPGQGVNEVPASWSV